MQSVVDEQRLTIVTLAFDACDPVGLTAALSRYVVLTRMEPGCRNVDLAVSATAESRYLVVEKWESGESQRAHLEAPTMVELARSCQGLLNGPPRIDLWDAASVHDLR